MEVQISMRLLKIKKIIGETKMAERTLFPTTGAERKIMPDIQNTVLSEATQSTVRTATVAKGKSAGHVGNSNLNHKA